MRRVVVTAELTAINGPCAPNIISLEAERTLRSLHEVLAILKADFAEPADTAAHIARQAPDDAGLPSDTCGEGA